ncbi:NAD-binding protein [Candidatus Synechococcus calcipolaris G9]|uniref:NAD-binding protein n=1 Tax=Candidatus Synechococcus calcipolaris G9 TaxID=1497997 RepID=A0ABT6EZU3_9SYNE|nr:NAD-binding protein [Candidatus Synechococcus calcipolaris]MDG2991094.1 NAD-binding protein [Candidatus Synechococcus calcipolaris G9]
MSQVHRELLAIIDRWLRVNIGDRGIEWSLEYLDHRLYIWLDGASVEQCQAWSDRWTKQWNQLFRQLPHALRTIKVLAGQKGHPFPLWQQTWEQPQPVSPASSLGSLETLDFAAVTPGHDPTVVDGSETGERFIICGLGSLGQYCIDSLRKFAGKSLNIHLCAIERQRDPGWEVQGMTDILSEPVLIGDCRQPDCLEQAGIHSCRTILFVTSDEATNIAGAIAARRLNPQVHLVVRSGRKNLNALLQEKLGSCVALDPMELPAPAFALAGLGDEILAALTVEGQQLRIVQHGITADEHRYINYPAQQLQRRHKRLLTVLKTDLTTGSPSSQSIPQTQPTTSCFATSGSSSRLFHQWSPDLILQVGDRPISIELIEPVSSPNYGQDFNLIQSLHQWLRHVHPRQLWQKFWQWVNGDRSRRIIFNGLEVGVLLWLLAAILLRLNVAEITWQKSFIASFILLTGGFSDVFGGLEPDPVPAWVQGILVIIALISLLFILGVFGLLAEKLLQSRFEFFQKRPPIPDAGHVILVGLGQVGQQVAQLLREFQQPFVVIVEDLDPPNLLPDVPILEGNIIQQLPQANLATAKSIILTSDDEMLNLEAALIARGTAQGHNNSIGLVVRTYDQLLSQNLAELLPNAQGLCVYELAAEAFAGAAFGENILGLFQIANRTVLVADYALTPGDTLVGKLMAEIAYGYGVVPVFYQKESAAIAGERTHQILPGDDVHVGAGDRLVILATIQGLRRIERGELAPRRTWRLWAGKPLYPEAGLEAGNIITNISGCPLSESRKFIAALPTTLELALYDHQVYRLGQQLRNLLPLRFYPV